MNDERVDPRSDRGSARYRIASEAPTWAATILVALLLAFLAGCQSAPHRAPPAASPAADRHAEALRAIGFEPAAEGWLLGPETPIRFEVNRDELDPDARRTVAKVAESLRRIGVSRVRVEGHADNSGTREYNADLSRRRAEAVARALVDGGFSEAAIVRRGLGVEYPAAPNDSRAGRAANRRVAIIVLADD